MKTTTKIKIIIIKLVKKKNSKERLVLDGLRALKNETLTTEMILRRMMGLGMTLPFHVLKWRSERNQMGQHWVGRDGFSGKGFSSSSSQTLQENAEQTKVLSCSPDFSPFSNYYYFLKLNYIYSTYPINLIEQNW